ncbi:Ubiquitin-like protease domain-containing protein [Forsythia ovata]|uniref:Ubiquitin-like protease domain-containing protein n=1 Tax=Forsythia ovata TaxID=205694 RepID=A0ABD1X0Y5_9LAMI
MGLNDQVSREDVVKLAKLYLISCFLYTTSYNKSVDERHMRLVDRLECDDFAWGEDLYRITLRSFKSALSLENKKRVSGKKSSWSYRLNGFPLSLQLWAYETIACLNGKFCTKVGEAYPRMLKWESDVHVTGPQLEEEVFKHSELEVIQFVATNEEKNEIYASGLFHKKQTGNEFGASSSRPAPGEKGKGCCELNEIVMNRLSQIEFKQQELERNQAQIISLHNDLRKEMTNLNRNVQGMFAEFLNQFGKETGGSCYNVLDRQIVMYTGDTSSGRKVEDQNTEGNGVDFDTFNNENVGHGGTDFEVPFEDVIGSRAEDVEVGREVQFDRKGKRVQVDKSNNESGPEFEVGGEEPKKYLFEGTFVSKRMFDVLNFCPSFDLGIDDEPNANDIELDDMEFTELDLKMIDECVQMRYLSTSKNEEDVDADDDYILVDDSTPDIPRKRLRKAAAVFKSPYTSNFGSSAKIREIRTGTYALPDELNAVAIEDVVDFEEWYIVGLLKKNK